MLVLTRKLEETIIIKIPGEDEIKVTLLGVKGNQVRIGVGAPRHIDVHREEVYLAAKADARTQGDEQLEESYPVNRVAADARAQGNERLGEEHYPVNRVAADARTQDDEQFGEESYLANRVAADARAQGNEQLEESYLANQVAADAQIQDDEQLGVSLLGNEALTMPLGGEIEIEGNRA